MSYFLFIIKTAIDDLKANKLRSLLTALGILIGIMSVVLLLSLGLGLKRYIEGQFESLGANLIMILPGQGMKGGFSPGGGMMAGASFDDKDVKKLRRVKNVSIVAPMSVTYLELKAEGNSKVYEIAAGTTDMFTVMNMEVDVGEYFDKADVRKGSKVVVLGSGPANKIFGSPQNAVGKIVKMDDQPFKVVGVSKSKGGGFGGPSIDDHVFIPFKAGLSFNPSKKYFAIYLKAKDENLIEETKAEIEKILLKRYKEDDFSVSDQKEMLDMLSSIFNILNIVLVGIAAISLVVGGVGVMNIMYVSVAEKIKEIGIRRAVGATGKDILFQFLAEAVILSLLGGVMAIGLAFAIIALIQKFFPAYIDLLSVCLALSVCSIIGIVFGVLPAKKAADLTPVEAIRKE